MNLLSAILPTADDLRALLAVAGSAMLLALAGRALAGGRVAVETCLIAGWGTLCCLFTLWAVATPYPLYGAIAVLVALSAWGALRRPGVSTAWWRLAILTAPLWVVLATARPGQVDTWLNLLPNQAYLVDHGRLPTTQGPLSYSFLPVAPYNTQFVAFVASTLAGGLVTNAMGLFNVVLQAAAGLLLARVLSGADLGDEVVAPPWWACGAGWLLAMPLNPGFLPKVFVSGYGEAPLAVTTLFATWLMSRLFQSARSGSPVRPWFIALAFTLAAEINVKQSSIGLVLPLATAALVLGLLCPGMERRRWAMLVTLATMPALLLFVLWRWYVAHDFPGGELTVLPLAKWNVGLLPGIVGAMLASTAKAPIFAATIIAVLAACAVVWRRHPWSEAAIILALVSATTVLFNGFLVFTYVSHFKAEWAADAHSYRRYLSQLSLALVLGLTVWLRPWAAARMQAAPRIGRHVARLAIALAALWPAALVRPLRTDLAAPQPELWTLAHAIAGFVATDDRLGLVLPGDVDDAVGSLLRGVLLFTPPRRYALDFTVERFADDAALAELAARGVSKAFVSCAPAGGLAGLPPDTAGMLTLRGGAWHAVAAWPYPAGFNDQYFSAWLPHAPLCGHDAFSRFKMGLSCGAEYPPEISPTAPPPPRPCRQSRLQTTASGIQIKKQDMHR